MRRLDLRTAPASEQPSRLRRFARAPGLPATDRALMRAVAARLDRARAGHRCGPLVTDAQLHRLADLVRT